MIFISILTLKIVNIFMLLCSVFYRDTISLSNGLCTYRLMDLNVPLFMGGRELWFPFLVMSLPLCDEWRRVSFSFIFWKSFSRTWYYFIRKYSGWANVVRLSLLESINPDFAWRWCRHPFFAKEYELLSGNPSTSYFWLLDQKLRLNHNITYPEKCQNYQRPKEVYPSKGPSKTSHTVQWELSTYKSGFWGYQIKRDRTYNLIKNVMIWEQYYLIPSKKIVKMGLHIVSMGLKSWW